MQKMLRITLAVSGCLLFIAAAAAAERPNILLILSDDHAKKALSCYGNTDIETPALDRIAREGMRFNHALTPNSFCTPARAAVLTGKYSHKNGVTHLNQSFDGSQQTFPKLLQAAGYQTSLFGKWHLLSQPTGFDFYCVQKMQGMPVDPIVFETGMPWIPWSPKDRKSYREGGRKLKGYNNDAITTEALNWLKEKRDPNKPFCMLLHPKPPHQPYKPPQKYEEFLQDVTIPEPATLLDDYKGRTPEAIQDIMSSNRIVLGPAFKAHRQQLEKENPKITRDELTRAMYQEYIKGYYRLVKSVDDNVGRVLDYLDQSGLAENTLVIYTSDQGFSLGEHGFYNKQWMYEGPLHQPLLVRFPGSIKPDSVHDSMVNHVDLAPTILEYAGVTVPDDMQGHSLKGILEGNADKVRDASYYHFYAHGTRLPEMIGIRTATHKLIHYPCMQASYQWELFDLQNDSEEIYNLYGSPRHRQTRERLKRELRKLIAKLDDPVDAPSLTRAAAKTTGHNAEVRSGNRPNIVLMMSDDQGWGEAGYNGHPHLKTPVLDQMAASGLRLDRFYAASPVCSPTRASVLTGRHANRCGAFGAGWSIRPEEITLASILKAAGYRTAHFGKWHVGAVKKNSPLSPVHLGFEESLSHDNFFEINPELSRNGRPAERIQGESSEILVTAALDFASRTLSEDHPFFIVLWFGSPHAPYEASAVDRAPYKHLGEELSHRLGEIAAMDRAIGMFRQGLDELGARNGTLLWFNSDNGITKEGIPREQQAELFRGSGLRGNKSQMYEGGLRVPGIIEWPAVISAARSSTVPCVTSDIMPTLLDILGITHPEPHRPLDGVSLKTLIVDGTMKARPAPIGFWSYDRRFEEGNERWISENSLSEMITLTARQKATLRKRPHTTWYFRNHKHPVRRTSFGGPAAWIDGRYKLVIGRGDQSQQVELYDLEADRGEANNIASQHPDKVGAMTRQLHDWQQSVENSLTGADYTMQTQTRN